MTTGLVLNNCKFPFCILTFGNDERRLALLLLLLILILLFLAFNELHNNNKAVPLAVFISFRRTISIQPAGVPQPFIHFDSANFSTLVFDLSLLSNNVIDERLSVDDNSFNDLQRLPIPVPVAMINSIS
ncbi:hypothetical protein DERP_002607 [Dermatophagoides pteronyssinus]|uniref:Uncharacterized protein n=1 Tax=Dermatophagoides pteronyssinus TaxID=6956 RepID=A0ABQ8JIT0_DERPT|nr:hypothetical protein DERP_002607 [Dermatophagoides pteronyssinus]